MVISCAAGFLASGVCLATATSAFGQPKPRHVPEQTAQSNRADDGNQTWQQNFALMANPADPVASKLLTWLYVTQTKMPVDAQQMMGFVRNNPTWPKRHVFRDRIEKVLGAGGITPQQIIDWCGQNPPASYEGMRAYLDALLHFNQTQRAKQALAVFWHDAQLSRDETASLYSSYRHYFAPSANNDRLDNLIWQNRYAEADYMLAFVDANTRALAKARMALGRQSHSVDSLVRAVPTALQNDGSLLYERLRWRRRHRMDDSAIALLKDMPKTLTHPDAWWGEQNILARRKIEDKDYKTAYNIVHRHQLAPGSVAYAQAEWLLGWMALRQLNKPMDAYRHFNNLYRNVGAAISRARAAYWAARAADALPDHNLALQWDKIAAQFLSTYYGQLSYEHVYGRPAPNKIGQTPADRTKWQAFQKNDLVRAARLMAKIGLAKLSDPFLARLNAVAKTRNDYKMVARLAREIGRLHYAVQANKDIQVELGQFLFVDGYPIFSPLPAQTPEKALVHAIIHRESMFNPKAISPVGARGMMQLMPATAKQVARNEGETYNIAKLTADPRFNIEIGSAYLRELVDDYNGYYPLAIAAYNAGPANVNSWLKTFGDPRKGDMGIVDWIEHIPNYETRNYVQRVMETYYIYRLRFGEKPLTVLDFQKQ